MTKQKLKQASALIGVIVIIALFILTIVFLLLGNSTLAIVFVAINGFVSVTLYFTLRFHQSVKNSNKDFTE